MSALPRRILLFKLAIAGLATAVALIPSHALGFSSKKRNSAHRLNAPVFDNQDCPVPNQPDGPWMIGNDFTVNAGHTLWVTSMGAFDAQGKGLKGDVLVGIYDIQNQRKVPGTFALFKAPGTSYVYGNQSRWQNITPVLLQSGKYTVVAANYGPSANPNCASGFTALPTGGESPLRFNSLGGALTIDGGRWLAQGQPWKDLPDAPPSWSGVREAKAQAKPLFAAGSFASPQDPKPIAPYRALPPLLPPNPPPHQVPESPLGWTVLIIPSLLGLAVFLRLHRRPFRR